MPHPLVLTLFHDVGAASAAARELHGLGVERADLSVVAADHQIEGRIADQIDATPGSEIEDSRAASRIGELSGYVLAAIAIGLPGTGALVAAGPLAAELGEAAGHVAGQVAGDLKATLVKAGLAESDAEHWRSEVEGGGAVLLGVHARAAGGDAVRAILARHARGPVVQTTWE